MSASSRPSEQLTDLVGEAAGNAETHKLLVGRDDRWAFMVREFFEVEVHPDDLKSGDSDPQLDHHMVHHDGLGIARNERAGGLAVADSAAGDHVRAVRIDLRVVGAVVQDLEIAVRGKNRHWHFVAADVWPRPIARWVDSAVDDPQGPGQAMSAGSNDVLIGGIRATGSGTDAPHSGIDVYLDLVSGTKFRER